MDENWLAKLFRNLNCFRCNSRFFIKGFTLKGSRCPVLLQCGHSVCYFCVRQCFRASCTITCPHCRVSCTLEPKSTPEQLPLNLHMLGILTMFQFERQERDRKLALLTCGDGNFSYSVHGKSNANKKRDILCEECLLMAYWSCETCQCNFCESCWAKVHGAAKSLMKHVKLPASYAGGSKATYRKCFSHEMQDINLFCKSCSKAVCSHCVIEAHQGGQHCLITLKDQALEMVDIVKTAAEEAEVIFKRMKHTLQKIKFTQTSLETSENEPYSDIRNQILQNFARLHGILQLQEEKCLKQLHCKANEKKSTLNNLCKQLETQIQKTEFLLDQYRDFIRKPEVHDMNTLYDQLLEVKGLPCYLISQNCTKTHQKVTFDVAAIELMEGYCTVELSSPEIFELRSGADLPEDFAVDPLPVLASSRRVSARTVSGSNSDLDSVSVCSSRDLHNGSDKCKLNSTRKPVCFYEGRKYCVYITFIKNPGEFYVTLNSQRKIRENIERRAENYGYPFIISSAVSKDELYLVQHKGDNKWYRGRVVEVLPKSSTGQNFAVVHFIDYGSTDSVPIAWMKPLSPDLYEEPPLAVKCRLFNCVPRDGKWSKDSVQTMEKIVNGLVATLFVMKVQPDCLEVDLSIVYPDGQIGRDIVSVRDALIFLEHASFVGGPVISENPAAVKYDEQTLPSIGEHHDVIITHVNSPDDFYLHRTNEDSMFLCDLGSELDKYYEENPQKGIIYNPKIGMVCAAKFSEDKKWYRAVIEDLPGNKTVTVYYVDYGNKENVSWMDIRKLRESFVKRPPVAIACSLAQIQPKVPGNWDPKAKSYLVDCILTQGISMQVEGRHGSEPKLKILLYKEVEEKNVCVNFLFIDMGFTCTFISKSSGSLPKLYGQGFGKGSDKDEKEKSKDTVFEKPRRFKLSAKELREMYELEKQAKKTVVKENESDNSETGGFEDANIRVKVDVLSAESPSCIYVSFSKGNEDFKNLQRKLNEFYGNTLPIKSKEWAVDSKCAVYNSEKENWCRASVTKILADDKVKVFLKDFAVNMTVHSASLRELDPIFVKYGPRAVKCHLSNVAPPGDTWPGISCEYLVSEMEGYHDVYMSKKGEIENNSLPVELWVQRIIPGGALEPNITEWITLNKLLVDKGLAVPKQNLYYLSMAAAEEKASTSKKEAESVSEESETLSEPTAVLPLPNSKWPPPEPFKKSRFTCIPTYVDLDGVIYIQDIDDQEELLKIRDCLQKEYENSNPSAEDHFWSAGELCIAKYFVDKEWYRGQILETNSDGKYEVLFVDYGNVETCEVADLRKRVKMLKIPILVHKFKLHDVAPNTPDGKWPIALIEVIHSLIVDKKCEVTILPEHGEDPYRGLLSIIEDNKDVGSVLIQEKLATQEMIVKETSSSSDDKNSSVEKEATYIPEVPALKEGYVPLKIPEDCKRLEILVKEVQSENEFYGHIIDTEFLPLDLKKALEEFQKLEETLADECHLQPKLMNIVEGKVCCCVHLRSNKWCRGQIESVKEDSVCIFYIDYGYKEIIGQDLVHECKLDWLKLPKMAVQFDIPNLAKSADVSKTTYMENLTSLLVEKKFLAEILGRREGILEMELLAENGKTFTYAEIVEDQSVETA